MDIDVRDPDAAFTADEIEHAQKWEVLGPAYAAAQKTAEAVMAGFEAEHFKPLVDKLAGEFSERLWGDLERSLLSDTESNLQSSLWRMVDATVNALLTGDKWAVERYVTKPGRYGDAEKVRAAIVEHCREQIADQRIADLEDQIASMKRELEWARR